MKNPTEALWKSGASDPRDVEMVDELVQDWLNHTDVEAVYAYAEEELTEWYLNHPDTILESYNELKERNNEKDSGQPNPLLDV